MSRKWPVVDVCRLQIFGQPHEEVYAYTLPERCGNLRYQSHDSIIRACILNDLCIVGLAPAGNIYTLEFATEQAAHFKLLFDNQVCALEHLRSKHELRGRVAAKEHIS